MIALVALAGAGWGGVGVAFLLALLLAGLLLLAFLLSLLGIRPLFVVDGNVMSGAVVCALASLAMLCGVAGVGASELAIFLVLGAGVFFLLGFVLALYASVANSRARELESVCEPIGLRVQRRPFIGPCAQDVALGTFVQLTATSQQVQMVIGTADYDVTIVPDVGVSSPTGETSVDQKMRVTGNPAAALAFLSEENRAAIRQALELGISVRRGRLVWEGPLELALERVRFAAPIAIRLTGVRVLEALAERALKDPVPAARERALQALLEEVRTNAPAIDPALYVCRVLLTETGDAVALRAKLMAATFIARPYVPIQASRATIFDELRPFAERILTIAQSQDGALGVPEADAAGQVTNAPQKGSLSGTE